MKSEVEATVQYRVEVECLDKDPITGYAIQENITTWHANRILSELPFMDQVEICVMGELEIKSVKIYKKGTHYDWMLLCQYNFSEEEIAKRVRDRIEAVDKLASWRSNALPGERASLAEILGDTPL